MTSRRVIRIGTPILALLALSVVLYNATLVDRVPPTATILLSKTAPGSSLALSLTSIDVRFSEDVREATARQAFSITPAVAGSFNWEGQRVLIFTPSDKLKLSTSFKVRIGPGVEDLAGNAQSSPVELTFTTVGSPSVSQVSPAPDAQNVAVASKIQVTFDRLIDPRSIQSAVRLDPATAFSTSWNAQVLTISPTRPLLPATQYTLSIGSEAQDTDGNHLIAYQSRFKTVGVGLFALDTIPANGVAGVSVRTPIAIVFDGPLDPATISSALQITPPVAGTTSTIDLATDRLPLASQSPAPKDGGHVLLFTPSRPLASHTTYSVTLEPVLKRSDGQVATQQSWTFTTGEPPTTAQNQVVFLSDRSGVTNLWLMNPDGSNQREVTSELVPVAGFDVSGDGATVVYTAGGVVKRMGIGGGDLTTVTQANRFEYAPSLTPDATAVILGRRDASGADLGYWRVPLGQGGGDERQLTADGAPGLGSVSLGGDGLTDSPGLPSWAPRAASSRDGKRLLLVRGSDGAVVLIDPSGSTAPVSLGLTAQSAPVWSEPDGAFYLVASDDGGSTWATWRIKPDGTRTRLTTAVGSLTMSVDGHLAGLVQGAEGAVHLGYAATSGESLTELTHDASLSERSPSFSPDGMAIVFGRVPVQAPAQSQGIWLIRPDGAGLQNLSIDGAYPRWLP